MTEQNDTVANQRDLVEQSIRMFILDVWVIRKFIERVEILKEGMK